MFRRPRLRHAEPARLPLPELSAEHLPTWISLLQPRAPQLDEVAQSVKELLEAVPTRSLFALDERVRFGDGWHMDGWRGLRPEDVRTLVQRTGEALAIAAATCMNRNGFVREAAVRELDQIQSPDVVRWLIVRSTDWVPEIRTLATAALHRRMKPVAADRFVDALPLLVGRRFDSSREIHSIRTAALDLLSSPAGMPALLAGTRSSDWYVRRHAFGATAKVAPSLDLLRDALGTGDLVAAGEMARALLSADDTRVECIRTLALSRLVPLQAVAVWEARNEPSLSYLVQSALFDRSPGVRRLAQQVAAHERGELRDRYRAALTDRDRLEAALHGIADLGDAEDSAYADAFARDSSSRVRAAAARLLACTGGPSVADQLAALALDSSSRVAKEAMRGLLARGVHDPVASRLYAAAEQDPDRLAARVFRRLLKHGSRWLQLRYGLRAAGANGPLSAEGLHLVRHALDQWNQSFTDPRVGELDEIRALFDQARSRVRAADPRLVAEIDFILDRYRPAGT